MREPLHQPRLIQILTLTRPPCAVLVGTGGQAALGNNNPVRDADEFDVGEHHVRAQAAVVEDGFDVFGGAA